MNARRERSAQERYELWLGFVLGTSEYAYSLLDAFEGDAAAVFRAAAQGQLPHAGAREEAHAARLRETARERYIDRCLARLDALAVSAAPRSAKEYPALLKEIEAPPLVLYYRGRLESKPPLPIAVVGSRMPSAYGKRVAEELSRALAESGACIVSGLAHGIDCIASLAALEAAGNDYPTVAVLGSGVDVIYPSRNREAYEAILARGAIVSEFPPGTPPRRANFPQRNRIISGLARGVLVVEAAANSGALITADHALEQGRDVFAVPGRVADDKSAGTNALIRDGAAKMVLSAEDVLEEYGRRPRAASGAKTVAASDLPFEQALVFRLLQAGERSFDELCVLTGFSVAMLNSTLTEMEFSEIIIQSPGRVYSI